MFKKIFIPTVIILAGILLVIGLRIIKKKPQKKESKVKAPLVQVRNFPVKTRTIKINGNGTVTPDVSVNLISEVSGKIVNVSDNMKTGMKFTEGEILFQIDPTDYELRLKSAKAQLLQQKMLLKTEQRNYDIAAIEWEEFSKQNPGIEPDSMTLRIPQLKIAEANYKSAEANLELAELNLERTKTKAPFDGIVISRNVNIGQFVGAGTALSMIYGTETAIINVPVKNAELKWLKSSFTGKAVLKAEYLGEEKQWDAHLVRKEAAVDNSSRMTNLVLEVHNPYSEEVGLPFGLFVNAEISGRKVEGVIVLPRHFVKADNTVLTVVDNKISFKKVRVLKFSDEAAIIESGLSETDKVVTSSLEVATQGMLVRIKEK